MDNETIPPKGAGRGGSLLAASVLTFVVLGFLSYQEEHSVEPRYSMALFLLLGLVAVSLGAAGVSALLTARRRAEGAPDESISYRHTYRLFGVIGGALFLALVARAFAVPASFGRYGHFRADASKDAMTAREPRYQGKQSCVKCHEDQFNAHEKDVHRTVQCEDCHGPADGHIKDTKDPNVAKPKHIEVPKDKNWCLVCHQRITARPGEFPQVSAADHFKFLGVKDPNTKCIECHNPHEPLLLQKPVAEARLHPVIHRCRDCHLNRTDEKLERPAEHPPIFECGYCHEKLTKDFDTTPHYELPCTTCHLYLKESESAGRIVLNRDPNFCLLCHGHSDIREAKVGPLVEWPDHMTKKDPTKKDDTTSCLVCHAPQIHGEHHGKKEGGR